MFNEEERTKQFDLVSFLCIFCCCMAVKDFKVVFLLVFSFVIVFLSAFVEGCDCRV